MKWKFADLFAGCGGLGFGFHEHDAFECLLAADKWKAAADVYGLNYPSTRFELLDLSNESEQQVVVSKLQGKCDIVLGGPPCQGFSTLGKRRDGDQRSTLVDSFADLIMAIRPKVFVMENVRGIVSKAHPSGGSYASAFLTRVSGAYDVEARLVDCLSFGLAQTRVRWVAVGFLRAAKKDLIPHTKFWEVVNTARIGNIKTLADAIGDLPYISAGEGDEVVVVEASGGKKEIYNHRAMRHSHQLVKRFSHVPPGGGLLDVPISLLTPHLRRMIDGHYGNGGHIKNIYGRLEWDKPSGTIVAGLDKITCGRFVHPDADRLLTPRECARIQSFPDSFKFKGSLVNQYYLIGNAVPPSISQIIAEAVAIELGNGRSTRSGAGCAATTLVDAPHPLENRKRNVQESAQAN